MIWPCLWNPANVCRARAGHVAKVAGSIQCDTRAMATIWHVGLSLSLVCAISGHSSVFTQLDALTGSGPQTHLLPLIQPTGSNV